MTKPTADDLLASLESPEYRLWRAAALQPGHRKEKREIERVLRARMSAEEDSRVGERPSESLAYLTGSPERRNQDREPGA